MPATRAANPLRLAELTSAEAQDRMQAGAVLLLPLGSQEDQGPHIPMGDYRCAERIAVLIAEQAGRTGIDTLVVPVLPFGGRDFFGSRMGGITLSQETLRAVLRDVFGCLLRHASRRMIVVNGHGGNAQAIHDVTQEILLEHGVLVPNLQLWRIAAGLLPGILGPEVAARAQGHGADPLASVAMHLFPALVRAELMPHGPAAPRDVFGLQAGTFGIGRLDTTLGDVEITLPLEIGDSAVTGDPRLSSAATGARLTETLVEIGAALIARLDARGWGADA
nr:creatininase family protein [uncultured Lichenicoccus sp.]